ncbi:TonB family protein [Burkholderia ambifaria]|uniref:TonB family protein n=1 Tax=Burkholderia ambifaria TaxID=152480 RepID=UPI00158BC240|nr:TonB family protein [Burkholderia ambifaria]
MKSILLAVAVLTVCLPAVAQETSAIVRLKTTSPFSGPGMVPAVAAEMPPVAPRRLNLHLNWSDRPAGAGDSVSVIAHVDEHGNVLDATIGWSSGDPQWDDTCVAAVRQASPLPAHAADPVHGGAFKVVLTLLAPQHPSSSQQAGVSPARDSEDLRDLLARRPEISTHSHILYSPRIVVGERTALQPPMSEFHFAEH